MAICTRCAGTGFEAKASGSGVERDYSNTCLVCSGTGMVPDPPRRRPQPTQRKPAKKSKKASATAKKGSGGGAGVGMVILGIFVVIGLANRNDRSPTVESATTQAAVPVESNPAAPVFPVATSPNSLAAPQPKDVKPQFSKYSNAPSNCLLGGRNPRGYFGSFESRSTGSPTPLAQGTIGRIFSAQKEFDLFAKSGKLYVFYGKSIDTSISHFMYDDFERSLTAVMRNGEKLDVGERVHCKLRPYLIDENEIVLARTGPDARGDVVTMEQRSFRLSHQFRQSN